MGNSLWSAKLGGGGAKIPLPSNFSLHEWDAIAHSGADRETIQFLKYRFPMGFEDPIPTPSSGNFTSAMPHPRDVGTYIKKETTEGAMLGSFPQPPFTLWCQTNPILTHPKHNSTDW